MAPLVLSFLAAFALALFGLPLIHLALRGLPRASQICAALLLPIWLSCQLFVGGAQLELCQAMWIAVPAVFLGSLPTGRWRLAAYLAGWVLAAGVLIWHGAGIDLELLRGTLWNGAFSLLFYLCVAGGLEVTTEPDPSRATTQLMLGGLALLLVTTLTGQAAISALAVPALAIAIAVHLHLLPIPEFDSGRQLVTLVGLILAGLTLATGFSEHSRLGALAAPLIWSVPGITMLHRLLLREPPPHQPLPETILTAAICGCAVLLAVSSPGGLARVAAFVGIVLAVGLLIRPWLGAGKV